MKYKLPNLLLTFSLLFVVYSCDNTGTSANKQHQPPVNKYHISGLRGQDSIISSLEQELQDPEIKANFSITISQIIATLRKSKTDRSVLFPSEPFDKVSLYVYAPPVNHNFQDRNTHFIKDLSPDEADTLFQLLNNPLYYQWAECGTPIEEYSLSFYRESEKIAAIDLCCNLAQITGIPESHVLSRYGGLSNEGVRYLKENILGTE